MQAELSQIIDVLFRNSVGRLPYFNRFSPDIQIVGNSDKVIGEILAEECQLGQEQGLKPKFLDIGGADPARSHHAEGFDRYTMDLLPFSNEVIVADICHCPEIQSDTFDV